MSSSTTSGIAAKQWKTSWNALEDKLARDNYDTWAPQMKRQLESENLFGFVDGSRIAPNSLPMPANTPYGDRLVAAEHQVTYETGLRKTGAILEPSTKPNKFSDSR